MTASNPLFTIHVKSCATRKHLTCVQPRRLCKQSQHITNANKRNGLGKQGKELTMKREARLKVKEGGKREAEGRINACRRRRDYYMAWHGSLAIICNTNKSG